MTTCENCDRFQGFQFCSECGEERSNFVQSYICKSCHQKQPTDAPYCGYCGSKMNIDEIEDGESKTTDSMILHEDQGLSSSDEEAATDTNLAMELPDVPSSETDEIKEHLNAAVQSSVANNPDGNDQLNSNGDEKITQVVSEDEINIDENEEDEGERSLNPPSHQRHRLQSSSSSSHDVHADDSTTSTPGIEKDFRFYAEQLRSAPTVEDLHQIGITIRNEASTLHLNDIANLRRLYHQRYEQLCPEAYKSSTSSTPSSLIHQKQSQHQSDTPSFYEDLLHQINSADEISELELLHEQFEAVRNQFSETASLQLEKALKVKNQALNSGKSKTTEPQRHSLAVVKQHNLFTKCTAAINRAKDAAVLNDIETKITAKSNELSRLQNDLLQQMIQRRKGQLRHKNDKYFWQPDQAQDICPECQKVKFGLTKRRHHCRNCGRVVCKDCSSNSILGLATNLSKVCPSCFVTLKKAAGLSEQGDEREVVELPAYAQQLQLGPNYRAVLHED